MNDIIAIVSEDQIHGAVEVMRHAFITVAEEHSLTSENAPSNPAFMTFARLKECLDSGVKLYGLTDGSRVIGTVGIERSNDSSSFLIERLAVMPGHRHHGFGRILLDLACGEARRLGGTEAAVGIINQNTKLKSWFSEYGFKETQVKKYDHLPFDVCFMEMAL